MTRRFSHSCPSSCSKVMSVAGLLQSINHIYVKLAELSLPIIRVMYYTFTDGLSRLNDFPSIVL